MYYAQLNTVNFPKIDQNQSHDPLDPRSTSLYIGERENRASQIRS